MGPRALDRLPLLYVTLPPIAWFTVLYLAMSDEWLDPVRIAIYLIYAASATLIAGACVYVCSRSETGMVAAWLVSLTYEAIFFALALWGINILLIVRLLNPALVDPDVSASASAYFLQALSYAMIAGSATGTAVSAWVMVYGLVTDRLYRTVRWLPWQRRK